MLTKMLLELRNLTTTGDINIANTNKLTVAGATGNLLDGVTALVTHLEIYR